MISVDAFTCAYCGSCVSVCPVGALDLQEARIVVSDVCTDCGLCVPACPAGALSPSQEERGWPPRAKQDYTVVVIGAGPLLIGAKVSGSFTSSRYPLSRSTRVEQRRDECHK